MSWTKLDDSMGEHRKTRRVLRAAGLGPFGLHVLGILHSSRYLTDGFVEQDYVDETFALARTRTRDGERAIAALCEQGLWLPENGGFRLHDYLDHNPSRAQVEAKRRADAERKARGRGAMSNGSANGVRADTMRTDVGRRAESVRPVPSRPTPTTPPSPPKGGRARDQERYREELAEYATGFAALYPDHPPSVVAQVVGQGLSRFGGAKTTDEVLAYLERHEQIGRAA